MSWEVTFAVLAAAMIHAGWNAAIKRGRDALLETTLLHGYVALPALVAVALLPLPGATAAVCLAASTLVHCGYYFALSGAYRHGDLSLAYPVMRGGAPLFTALLGVVALGERPSPVGWLGIAAIGVGVLAIGLVRAGGLGRDARRRSLAWAALTAATIVAYTLIDSTGARAAPTPWSYVAWLALTEGPLLAAVVATRRHAALVAYARERGVAPMLSGIASMLAYGIALWAMTRAPVALVAALRETSVLFALLIARVVLHEPVGAGRWVGAAAIVAGIAALRFA